MPIIFLYITPYPFRVTGLLFYAHDIRTKPTFNNLQTWTIRYFILQTGSAHIKFFLTSFDVKHFFFYKSK